jgi:hypothetical protein
MRTILVAFCALLLAACAPAPEPTSSTDALLSPEPGSTPADYHSVGAHLRLLGVQPGDGTGGWATIADRTSWAAQNLRAGDFLARNFQLGAVTADGIDLRDATGTRHVRVGADFDLDTIRHRFDDAAQELGRHRWRVDGATMADILARYGSGVGGQDRTLTPPAGVPLAPESFVVLSLVDARGVIARLGLVGGDIVLAVDGNAVAASDLDGLAARLATPGAGRVTITVAHAGARYPLVIDVQ